jgi:hypothetical protein
MLKILKFLTHDAVAWETIGPGLDKARGRKGKAVEE